MTTSEWAIFDGRRCADVSHLASSSRARLALVQITKVGQISGQGGRHPANVGSTVRASAWTRGSNFTACPRRTQRPGRSWGRYVMTRRKRPTTIVKAFASRSLAFALCSGAVQAADLTSPPPAPSGPAPEVAPRWYAKLGVLGALDQSWSSLFAQQVAEVVVLELDWLRSAASGPRCHWSDAARPIRAFLP